MRLVPVVLPRRTALLPLLEDGLDDDEDPPLRVVADEPDDDEPLDEEPELPDELDPEPLDPLDGGADRTGCWSGE